MIVAILSTHQMKSIKSLLSIFVLALVVSGCQTVDDFIGTGPINISNAVANHYQNKYLKRVGPQYYVVTADGTDASYTYCAEGTGGCQFGVVVLDAITSCEKRSGQKCFIFAEGDEVVWKGPVSFGGRASPKVTLTKPPPFIVNKDPLSAFTDKAVCDLAVERGGWLKLRGFKKYIDEAKSRDLTPEKCRQALGFKPTRIAPTQSVIDAAKMAAFANKALCGLAVKGSNWETSRSFTRYVDEAKSRDLTPAKCRALLS